MVQWAAIWVRRGIHKWQANLHVRNATTQTTKSKERWVRFLFKFKTHQPYWRYFSKYLSFILIGSNPMANLSQPASVNQIWEIIRKNDDIVRKKKKRNGNHDSCRQGCVVWYVSRRRNSRDYALRHTKISKNTLCRWHLLFREYLQPS